MSRNILMPIMTFMTKYYHNFKFSCSFFSVSFHLYKIYFTALFFSVALFISSCEENPATIGTSILPDKDFVNIKSTDTLSVESYTNFIDSVRSDNRALSYLGKIMDPYFGECSADFVTQLRLSARWPGETFLIDSIKLFMRFSNVHGIVESIQTLKISEISDDLTIDTVDYSNRNAPETDHEIAEVQLPILKNDTINDIVLNMPIELADYLTRDTSKLFHSSTVPDFRSFFKGVYFRISYASDPLFMILDFSANTNYFILYYHNLSDQNFTYSFIINTKCERYNRYMFNYNAANPEKKIKHINDNFKDTVTYLQGLEGGVFTRIGIPGLNKLKSLMPAAVNQARLIVPVFLDNDIYTKTTMPTTILLKYTSSTGQALIVPDYLINPNFFSGARDTTKVVYTFNLAAFTQEYLEGKIPKPELEMFEPYGLIRNVILKANSNSTPVKFEFTYTEF